MWCVGKSVLELWSHTLQKIREIKVTESIFSVDQNMPTSSCNLFIQLINFLTCSKRWIIKKLLWKIVANDEAPPLCLPRFESDPPRRGKPNLKRKIFIYHIFFNNIISKTSSHSRFLLSHSSFKIDLILKYQVHGLDIPQQTGCNLKFRKFFASFLKGLKYGTIEFC